MSAIKVVVFDLYNTLIEIKESGNFFLKLYRMSQSGFGMRVLDYLQTVMTHDINDLMNVLPIEFKQLYISQKTDLQKELNSIIVYEEVFQILEDLKKDFKIYLISNLASPYKSPVFKNNLNVFFEGMIFSSDYGFLKPDKMLFREVERLSGSHSKEIVMVGDSFKSDVMGAKNMSWNYLKIKRKGNLLEDYEIRDLREVKKYINVKM